LRRNGGDAVTGDGIQDPFCPRCREMREYCVCDRAANTDTPKPDRQTMASRLVDIANGIYELGCAMTSRRHPGDPEPVIYVFAAPKDNPGSRRPLPDIRPDLVAVYHAMYGRRSRRKPTSRCWRSSPAAGRLPPGSSSSPASGTASE
jgi:hypothetical protein